MTSDEDARDGSAQARKALVEKIDSAITDAKALGLEYTTIVLKLARGTVDGTTDLDDDWD